MTDSDTFLLERFCENRDSEAFSEIVRLYAGVVYGACFRVLNDRDLARDAAQETFFQLLRNAGEVSGSLGGWLHTVATRRSIDLVRKDSARRVRESEYPVTKLTEADSWEDVSPFVDEALGEIDDQERRVLIKHFLEGLTTRQVAERLGCSQATVSRKINAGLDSIRAILKKRGILVAAVSLSGFMAENAVQAAPAVLAAELGKMSIAAGGSIAAGSMATAKATAVSAVAAVKAKVVTVAAVAVIGTGAVVTYNVTKEEEAEPVVKTAAVDEPESSQNNQAADRKISSRPQVVQTFVERSEPAEEPVKVEIAAAADESYEEPEPDPAVEQKVDELPEPVRTGGSAAKPRMGMMSRGGSGWRVEGESGEDQPLQPRGGGFGGRARRGGSRGGGMSGYRIGDEDVPRLPGDSEAD